MKLLVKQKKRSAVSPVIATLLLIAIAVAAAIIVYAFVTGLIGGLTGGSSGLIVESGTLSIPTGVATDGTPASYGALVLTVKNSGSAPINSITVTETSNSAICDSGDLGICPTSGTGWTAVWTGTTVTPKWSITASIPTGQSESFNTAITGGAVGTNNALAGTTYSYTVTVTFSSGTGNNIQTLNLVAQT